MAFLDTFENYAASAGRRYRGLKKTLVSGATSLTGFAPFVPQHLVIALQDLRTPDASLVQEFYQGRYILAGKVVDIQGQSPFSTPVDHLPWQKTLHSFAWLRHYSASNDPIAGAHALALVRDWIETSGGPAREIAWDMETAARRLIAWLNHSIVILSLPDHEFHQLFMRSLGSHVRFLKRHATSADEGMPVLLAYIALSYAAICFSDASNALQFSMQKLSRELAKQIPPDGGHISRNPQANVDLLALLLPLREGCVSTGTLLPDELVPAIERLLQGLRFYRLGDGNLARFNGASVSETELLSSLQRHEETAHPGEINGSMCGYERMQIGNVTAIFDAGMPPRGETSLLAHAGCLSFELCSGADCIVVNTGRPYHPPGSTTAVWRSTAAHSTAVFYETSSCKFENTGSGINLLDGQLFGSPLKVVSNRESTEHGISVTAHHLGYVREFGARHQRILTLDKNGHRLRGNDWFSGPDKGDLYYTTKDAVTIHFHLHPSVSVEREKNSTSVLLTSRSGEEWRFSCGEVDPEIEESIYFATLTGPKKTTQIALNLKACKTPEINWSLEKIL